MRCLIVSDVESSRDEKFHFLSEMNQFTAIGRASSADQAIEKLKKFSYGIIILDIGSSSEESMNLLKWIRAEKIFICAIMLSDENSAEYVSEAFSYGVADYILKPYTPERFKAALMRAVSKRECLMQFKYMTQEEIDHCISLSVVIAPADRQVKEVFTETFHYVRSVVSGKQGGFTAKDISEVTGLSRITVRRYLECMCENGVLRTQLEYGEIGRPKKLYFNMESNKEK